MEDLYSINSFSWMSSPFLLVLVSCVCIRPFVRSLAAIKKKLTSSVYEITHSVTFHLLFSRHLKKQTNSVNFLFIIQPTLEKKQTNSVILLSFYNIVVM